MTRIPNRRAGRLLPVLALVAVLAPPAARADGGVIAFQDENSTLAGGGPVDRNYVNGLSIRWVSPAGEVPGVLDRLAQRLFGPGRTRWGLGLSQQIYTPQDTQSSPPNPADRPYAGYLAATISLSQATRTHQDSLSLAVGVVGPGAGAASVMSGFHRLIGQSTDRGWHYQLQNEPTVELTAQRIWRLPLARRVDLLPELSGAAGNVRDDLSAGAVFRVGSGLGADFGPTRLPSGSDGGAAFQARRFAWYGFIGIHGQAVARDIFLDGNDWAGGPHVTRDRFVGEVEAGVVLFWHGWRLGYTEVVQSRSYHGQHGSPFNFGIVSAAVRF
ncbi:MAG: lipid A deacylase LpxR family protein [Acetobacteraceae bacterium]